MREKSKDAKNKPDFRTLIPEQSDEEIKEILKKRNLYQPEAADLAVKEAVKRGIIHSEQDLFSEEFRVNPFKSSLFPVIEKEVQRKKISKSICRGLIISGAIPLIYGIVLILDHNFTEGIALTVGGVLWLGLAVQLFREVKNWMINLFFVVLVIALAYLVNLFVSLKSFIFMDFFIVAIFYLLIIYGLIYLRKLNSKRTKE